MTTQIPIKMQHVVASDLNLKNLARFKFLSILTKCSAKMILIRGRFFWSENQMNKDRDTEQTTDIYHCNTNQ